MKIALITDNGTIQKIFYLSAQKRNYDLEINEINKDNDIVFVDNENINDKLLKKITSLNSKKVLILSKNDKKVPEFDSYLIKPFLPSDLINLLENIDNVPISENENINELFNSDTKNLKGETKVLNKQNNKNSIIDEIDEDILVDLDDDKLEDSKENKNEFDLNELDKINEEEILKAFNNRENNLNNKIDENNSIKNNLSLQEKTLGDILKINWEELKKAKAKVTITIDFGG